MSEKSWSSRTIVGQRVDVFEPEGAVENRALVVLAGHGERASQCTALTQWLAKTRWRAISPQAECWWLDEIEAEFSEEITSLAYLLEELMPWVSENWGVAPPNIRLLGWREGGQGILQMAFARPSEFPILAAIDAAIDFHELHGTHPKITELFENWEAARQRTALLRLHPAGWPRKMMLISHRESFWFEGVDRLGMKLRSMGIPRTEVVDPETGAEQEDSLTIALRHVAQESMGLPVVSRSP